MAKRSPWEPRPFLEANPWSLFPDIGLNIISALVVQALWFLFASIFALLRPAEWLSIGTAWLIGVWGVFYITQRLGGRKANLGGAAPKITRESPFQLRLVGDALYFLLMLFLAAIVAFGLGAVRASWHSL